MTRCFVCSSSSFLPPPVEKGRTKRRLERNHNHKNSSEFNERTTLFSSRWNFKLMTFACLPRFIDRTLCHFAGNFAGGERERDWFDPSCRGTVFCIQINYPSSWILRVISNNFQYRKFPYSWFIQRIYKYNSLPINPYRSK